MGNLFFIFGERDPSKYFYFGNYLALFMANEVAGQAEDKERKSGALWEKTTKKKNKAFKASLQLASRGS